MQTSLCLFLTYYDLWIPANISKMHSFRHKHVSCNSYFWVKTINKHFCGLHGKEFFTSPFFNRNEIKLLFTLKRCWLIQTEAANILNFANGQFLVTEQKRKTYPRTIPQNSFLGLNGLKFRQNFFSQKLLSHPINFHPCNYQSHRQSQIDWSRFYFTNLYRQQNKQLNKQSLKIFWKR